MRQAVLAFEEHFKKPARSVIFVRDPEYPANRLGHYRGGA